MNLLILLLQHPGDLVSREEIAGWLWGKDVFLDIDHSINTAVRKIRQVLHDDPEKPRYLETVIGKGYRFAAAVTVDGNSNQPQNLPALTETPLPPAPILEKAPDRRLPWGILAGAILIFVFAIAGFLLLRSRGPKANANTPIRSLAVLPLENLSGDPAQDYLADGMTEALIGRLAGIRSLRVISRTSIMQFKHTNRSVPEIAKMLGGVDAIVEGSVIRDGNRVRVHAQLIRATTDTHIWAETYDRDMQDVFALQSNLAAAIADKVAVTVSTEERTRLLANRNVSPEVYESYLKGRFSSDNSRSDIEKSISYFNDAIRGDPTFAPAYVGLAESYDNLASVFAGSPPEDARKNVVKAVRKALDLDPTLADAHIILADVYQERWQWADAETEFKRALDLNPNSAEAHIEYAGWLTCQGRTNEALEWARRGRELDPLADYGPDLGWILFMAHRYDDSIRELRGSLQVDPNNATTLWFLGFTLIAQGHPHQAIPPLEKAVTLSHRSAAVIGVLIRGYDRAGRHSDAMRLLAELKQRQKSGYIPAGAFVNAYLGLGDNEQAFLWLERACKEQSNILQHIKVHPYFDPIRSDPRFKDLIHRVGLDAPLP